MKTFRIHYRLNGENQTIDFPNCDNSTTASNKFLGRFSEGERRPVIKKIKILASEPTDNLPRRQSQIYEFIVSYFKLHGLAPTWQEIADGAGFKTKDQAFNCGKPLFRLGILGKSGPSNRSIQILIPK